MNNRAVKTKNKKIIAIIPARGGSKGIPKKNIKIIAGKPLIAYTIEPALKSKYLERVIVSTDSQEITEVAKKYGVEVPFLRPKELARDDSPVIDALFHALSWFEKRGECFDVVVLLEPTSPLRKDDDIDNAIKLFLKNYDKTDSLIGIGEIHSDTQHPYGVIKKIEAGYVKPFIKHKEPYQRQQLKKAYSVYGGIYISKVDTLKKYKTFYQKRTTPYFIERWQNYEIDDIYDFICVEAILKERLKKP